MSRRKGGRARLLDEEQEKLAHVASAPASEASRMVLATALASTHPAVVKYAAELIKQHQLTALVPDVTDAFERLLVDPVKRDPGCHAKLALLEALDYLETDEQDTFLLGARYVQLEPAWGSPADTAAALRARGVVALARTGYADLPLLAGELLADREPSVRAAAADALAHRELRESAGLLLLKLQAGDEDPMVTLALLGALLALAPDWALPRLDARLHGDDEGERELTALALGQSRSTEALALLLKALDACVLPGERATLLRAVGLHRSEPALTALLGVVAEGAVPDARAAVQALAARRFEPGLPARVRAAAARNARVDLSKELAATFAEE